MFFICKTFAYFALKNHTSKDNGTPKNLDKKIENIDNLFLKARKMAVQSIS